LKILLITAKLYSVKIIKPEIIKKLKNIKNGVEIGLGKFMLYKDLICASNIRIFY